MVISIELNCTLALCGIYANAKHRAASLWKFVAVMDVRVERGIVKRNEREWVRRGRNE